MSLYTTKYLDILRNYALPETNQTFDELIDVTYQDFWNFDFPWYASNDNGKIDFQKLFLLHYLMYEIGQETIELHRAMLASRLREIMPEMDQIYQSLVIELPWDKNVDMNYTTVGTSSETGNLERNIQGSITGESHDESSGSTNVDTQSITSDNPQVTFAENDYASGMDRGQSKKVVQNESTGSVSNTENRTEGEETSRNTGTQETRSESGYRGVTKGDIVKQMRECIYNINREIINRCEDLFMLVW